MGIVYSLHMSTAAPGHCRECRDREYKQRLAATDGTQREIKSYCPDNISHTRTYYENVFENHNGKLLKDCTV